MKGQIGTIQTQSHPHHGASLWHQLVRWHELYLQRQELSRMSDAALKDIGLSRADILEESERHFWEDPLKK